MSGDGYLEFGRVDDVDVGNVESEHAEDVAETEQEEDGIFHQWKVQQVRHRITTSSYLIG